MAWETALEWLTGLRWIDPSMDAATLLRTALVIHICDAIMCRLFAHNNRYPKNLWTVLGFVFGIWAVTVLILLPARPQRSQP